MFARFKALLEKRGHGVVGQSDSRDADAQPVAEHNAVKVNIRNLCATCARFVLRGAGGPVDPEVSSPSVESSGAHVGATVEPSPTIDSRAHVIAELQGSLNNACHL